MLGVNFVLKSDWRVGSSLLLLLLLVSGLNNTTVLTLQYGFSMTILKTRSSRVGFSACRVFDAGAKELLVFPR